MASAVDFSQLNRSVGPLLGGPVDAITAAINGQQADAEKEHLLQMRLDAEGRNTDRQIANDQNKDAYYKRKLDLAEKRDASKLIMENQKRRGATEDQIRAAVGAGDTPLAQQTAARYQEETPGGDVTSGLPGFETKPHGGAPEPGPPDALTAAMSNPVTRLAGMNDADINQARGAEAPPQAFQAEHDAWQGAPDIVALHGMDLNQDQIRHAGGRAAVQDFDQSVNAIQAAYDTALQSGDQQTASTYKRHLVNLGMLRPQVESGAIPLGKALAQASDPKMDLAAGQNETRLETARIGAKARVEASVAGNGRWEATNQRNDDKEERQKRQALRGEAEQLAGRFGIKDIGTTVRGLEDLQSAVENSGTNSADAARLVGKWVQLAQGDKRISNQDIGTFFGRIGGIEKYGNDPLAVLGAAASGTVPPEIGSQIVEAGKRMLAQQHRNMDQYLQAGDQQFPGFYGKHWDDFKAGLSGMATPRATGAQPADGVDPRDNANAPNSDRPLDGEGGEPPRITREQALKEAKRRGLVP